MNFALGILLACIVILLGHLGWRVCVSDVEPFVSGYLGAMLYPLLGCACWAIGALHSRE